MGLKTVAGSCFGSPIKINLLQPYIKGIKEDIYTAWPPSSITTVSKIISAFYNKPLPDEERVVKTSLQSFKIFFFIDCRSLLSDFCCFVAIASRL